MNIAAYCRVSTNKEDQLNSLQMQKEFFEDYARKNNYNLIKIYADEGISGTKLKNRLQFQQMMRDAEKGNFDLVVTKDVSRFARNTLDFLENFRKLKGMGIRIEFLSYNMESMGNSEMMLTMLASVAQEESANISKRVKLSKKKNAEKGKVPNICYGYDKVIGDYFNLNINREEAQVVKEIFKMYTEDLIGANKIANCLNSKGIKTKRGCKWSQNAICRILSNEIYIGQVINGKQEIEDFLTSKRTDKQEHEWIRIENKGLRIISDEQFYKAQKLMQSRKNSFQATGEKNSTKHLFSKMIKCKECGYSFRRIERNFQSGKYIKWTCSGRNTLGKDFCSNNVMIDEQDLKDFIFEFLESLMRDKNVIIKNARDKFKKIIDKSSNNTDVNSLKLELANIEKLRKKQIEMFNMDLITIEELNDSIGHLKSDKLRLENSIKMLENNTAVYNYEEIINSSFDLLESILSSKDITNEQLRKIIKNITVDIEGNVDIYTVFSSIQDTI